MGKRLWKHSQPDPTPAQALIALQEGRCLYSPVSRCSGPPKPVGLRNEDDSGTVLVCRAHFGRFAASTRRQERVGPVSE